MSDQPPVAIRVLLVDDEPMVRSGLAAIIGTTDDIVVVGEAADGEEALARIEADAPDVVLLDIRMPGEDGVAVTRRIVTLDEPPAVLILTTWDSDAVTLQAIGAGAAGFLLKTDAGLDILEGIRAVAAGRGALSQSPVQAVLSAAARSDTMARSQARDAVRTLSPREREAIVALSGPGNLDEVAARMFVAKSTLKSHMESAQRKLGVSSRHELAVIAARAGLV
ncbi:LuxR family two component transcriptional regulator [Branchiibius hedensis]|uniref:DNA-binding response regulator, NarL/FixJ family, contains REC and HTH domains n=1 Tax=Branchiibius hedensis TaxID=672460 RepID=A0A2Y9BUH7_9MICO|nr:response regulator transcription factor [Branchiibius hedensis]PWJ26921.1 LuxR family two component transcriptional regulator [Branchiibius hedensis]SSA35732.1 DNA-binding response regulator, NarL/FixJ family, contains REC and HTH domains [Branchiibius hedensis]